jgi:D-3-phosphoglycerate dehydrogenase
MTVGREEESKQNVILLNTDARISKELLAKVHALKHIDDAMVLELPQYQN